MAIPLPFAANKCAGAGIEERAFDSRVAQAALSANGEFGPSLSLADTAKRYHHRMPRFDRHRAGTFLRFTVRRFLDEHCLQTAGALALTSLFALVPLITVVLGILAAFPEFAQWREKITVFIFANFVPATGDVVQAYFTQFADNASKATAVGVLI